MTISSIVGQSQVPGLKPQAPTAPVPPAGGNIENRQPPSEPSPPPAQSGTGSAFRGTVVNIIA